MQKPPPSPDVPSLRSAQFLRFVLLATFAAIPVALVTIGFMASVNAATDGLWRALPSALGLGSSIADLPAWYVVAVPTLAGLLVAMCIRWLPGHGGPPAYSGHGLGGEEGLPAAALPGVAVVAFISLVGGASLGPEAPLLTVLGGAMLLLTKRLELAEGPSRALQAAVIATFIAVLFDNPLAAGFLLVEVLPLTGVMLYTVLIPALVAAVVAVGALDALGITTISAYSVPAYDAVRWIDVPSAIVIGVVGAAVGVALPYGVRFLNRLAARVVSRPKAGWAVPVVGGAIVGLLAVASPDALSLFSGESEFGDLLDAAGTIGAGAVLVLLATKTLAFVVSISAGFRGGRIFPSLFIGGVVGVAAHTLVDAVPLGLAVACGMAAVTVAATRFVIFPVLLAVIFVGPASVPFVIISAVVAYGASNDRLDWGDLDGDDSVGDDSGDGDGSAVPTLA
jgi:H+/Cl- antiporter ClcA